MSTHTCAHCGLTCGDYAGGFGGMVNGDGPMLYLCHPNDSSRPDCYRRVTVYGEPVGCLWDAEPKLAGVDGISGDARWPLNVLMWTGIIRPPGPPGGLSCAE